MNLQYMVWYGAQQFEVALLEVYNRDTPMRPISRRSGAGGR